jgi:hypothetical protein
MASPVTALIRALALAAACIALPAVAAEPPPDTGRSPTSEERRAIDLQLSGAGLTAVGGVTLVGSRWSLEASAVATGARFTLELSNLDFAIVSRRAAP